MDPRQPILPLKTTGDCRLFPAAVKAMDGQHWTLQKQQSHNIQDDEPWMLKDVNQSTSLWLSSSFSNYMLLKKLSPTTDQ